MEILRSIWHVLRVFILAGLKGVTDELKAINAYVQRVQAGEAYTPVDEAALRSLMVNYWGLSSWKPASA